MTREELKGKQTPGEGFTSDDGLGTIVARNGFVTAHCPRWDGQAEANAALYAEAHNVANRTGLWPEDMEARIKELEVFASRAAQLIRQCKSDAEDLREQLGDDEVNQAWWDEVCELDANARAIINKS